MQNPDNLAKNQQLICPSTYTGATQLTATIPAFVANNLAANGSPAYFPDRVAKAKTASIPAFVANNLTANGSPAYFPEPVAKAKTANIPAFVATLSQREFSVFLANRQINNQGSERNTVPTKPVKTIFG